MKVHRRHFLKTLTGASLALTFPSALLAQPKIRDKWGVLMPLNDLGSTGEKVTMMGLGGFHVGRMDDSMAQETVEMAMEYGIRFFDTAESYVEGEAEKKYGKFLTPKYRDEAFIMTKTRATDKKTAEDHLNHSLSRMKTDRIDLWMMHAINSEEDAENRLNNGVLDYMLEAKQKGLVKHVGFSGHTTTKAHIKMLSLTNEIEAVMMPINAIDWGYDSFIKNVLPVLQDKKKGVIAMKTLAGGSFFGRGFDGRKEADDTVMDHINVNEAIQFAFSTPNDVLVTGPKDPAMLKEKIAIANEFTLLNDSKLEQIFAKIQHLSGNEVEYYKGIP